MKRLNETLILLIFFAPCSHLSAQNEPKSFRNGIGVSPPLPGLLVVEYERLLTDYSRKSVWSAGISLGYGYDAGKFEPQFFKGVEDLFSTPVSFSVTRDYVINPFIRYYFGNHEKKIRPALMLKPSLVIINIENTKNYYYPAYEFHFMGAYSKKQFYVAASIGFKYFLKYGKIEYGGEETYFPAFRFDTDNIDEKPKRWLPATDIVLGLRF